MELDFEFHGNRSCDYDYVPAAIEHIESLNSFGIGLLSSGAILSILTIYFAIDACHNVFFQKETNSYKTNSIFILSVYPVASVCSLVAIGVPRAQLLSEAVTQIFLTISLYRLYLLMIDVGRRKVTKPPALMLRVGPCCCWPCLPFPSLEMTETNLSWLRMIVLQLPIVQGLTCTACLFMLIDEPMTVAQYSSYLQPVTLTSILLAIYGLTIALKSLQDVAPEAKLRHKIIVSQLVLLFSKLQAFVIKCLPSTGLFPCNPPITPQTYANVTFNALMLIEMLLLCYAARHVYYVDLDREGEQPAKSTGTTGTTDRLEDKRQPSRTDLTNNNEVGQPHV